MRVTHLVYEVLEPLGQVCGRGGPRQGLQRAVEGGQVLNALDERGPLGLPPVCLALQENRIHAPHLHDQC